MIKVETGELETASSNIATAAATFSGAVTQINAELGPIQEVVSTLNAKIEQLTQSHGTLRTNKTTIEESVESVRMTASQTASQWEGSGAVAFEGFAARTNSAAVNINGSLEQVLLSVQNLISALQSVSTEINTTNASLGTVNEAETQMQQVIDGMSVAVSNTAKVMQEADTSIASKFSNG